MDAYDRSKKGCGSRDGLGRGAARALSRASAGRGSTTGEDASAGLTPEGTSCRTPFAHFPALYHGAWALAGVAAAGLASWIYATVCWTASAATRGTEVIDKMVEAAKQSISRTITVTSVWADVVEDLAEVVKRLILRGGWIGERVFDILAKVIDRVFTQAGDVACYLIVVVAAVIGTSIIASTVGGAGSLTHPACDLLRIRQLQPWAQRKTGRLVTIVGDSISVPLGKEPPGGLIARRRKASSCLMCRVPGGGCSLIFEDGSRPTSGGAAISRSWSAVNCRTPE